MSEEKPKGIPIILSIGKIVTAVTAAITIMGAVITFSVKFQTDKYKAKIEKNKIVYETQLIIKEKELKECNDEKSTNLWEAKYKEVAPEYLYLKYSYSYTVASNKYLQNSTEKNLNIMKLSAKKFAKFIYVYSKQIIKSTKDPILIEMEYSSDRIKFPRNSYFLPQPVKMELEELTK